MENLSNSSQPKVAERVNFLSAFQGNSLPTVTISSLKAKFLDYIQFEKGHAKQTVQKYDDCLRHFVKTVGDVPLGRLTIDHVIELKKKLAHRNLSLARIASIIFALKSFLGYCREVLNLECIDSRKIKSPRRQKREVVYLTNEEIQQFIGAITLYTSWNGNKRQKRISIRGLRFRTLVEVLLGTGMRISEALFMNVADIDFKTGEATIVGKGNKQRTVFFNERALWWVKDIFQQEATRTRRYSLPLLTGND